jgi:uncharacterized protein YjiS (DUF1127 family)
MFLDQFLSRAQDRLAKRGRYRRLLAEIEALSDRDIADMGGNRSEMRHDVYRSVYGG